MFIEFLIYDKKVRLEYNKKGAIIRREGESKILDMLPIIKRDVFNPLTLKYETRSLESNPFQVYLVVQRLGEEKGSDIFKVLNFDFEELIPEQKENVVF